MRAPGRWEGNFALESALDELAHALGMDPLQLRLRNYADTHPQSGLPWSSKALRDCYQQGAQRFGWSRRSPEVGSMRQGAGWSARHGRRQLPWWQAPCQARATIGHNGNAFVRSAATDIGTGTGTGTGMAQLAAELLGLGLDRVRFELGDSEMPYAPQAGGSGLTAALGNAVQAACRQLLQAFLDTVADDPAPPLRGCRPDQVTVGDGRIHRTDTPAQSEAYTDILARHRLDQLTAAAAPAKPQDVGLAPAGPFAAKFVQVHVDPTLACCGSPGSSRRSTAAAS
jgi:CO/xanthine dehydrogenase Mo-binding subunit